MSPLRMDAAHDKGDESLHFLNRDQIEGFIRDGFLRIDGAFSPETAAAAREILWRDSSCDPNDRSTWTKPVIRLWDYPQQPFREAANMPVLHRAFDALVGEGRWVPRESLGTFPLRFPHPNDPGDTGWHVDASFPPDPPTDNYLQWRININSKGRALLMLFLFSDVGEDDAPTRIRVGSHQTMARLLAPAGEAGMPMMEISQAAASATQGGEEVSATGAAGTVYLCHPFILHAAQPHRGKTPRFMAQPPLAPRVPFQLSRADGNYSPVEQAIRLALSLN
ncbi:phytanoyl-CoA dioxygenase family protein [Occallatibacter savannae]|uniref:phytanoyl-CoA dioxygenase family protein n=1 Tax=Occallatibacter savannae TaxID=1002691 RepID=UPI001951D9F4|nr:phytanoyl-CoA dioxygenase family protein [Occallatibacter savannae]